MRRASARRTRSQGAGHGVAQALRATRPAHRVHLYLRRHLPSAGLGCCACLARLQHQSDEPAPCRDCHRDSARCACRPHPRPGRLAYVEVPHRAAQHHAPRPSTQMPGIQPVENVWQFMRDNWLSNRIISSYNPRTLLRGLEQTHRSAVADHVHRFTRLGTGVLINGTWYYGYVAGDRLLMGRFRVLTSNH